MENYSSNNTNYSSMGGRWVIWLFKVINIFKDTKKDQSLKLALLHSRPWRPPLPKIRHLRVTVKPAQQHYFMSFRCFYCFCWAYYSTLNSFSKSIQHFFCLLWTFNKLLPCGKYLCKVNNEDSITASVYIFLVYLMLLWTGIYQVNTSGLEL